jgi:uncharacterized protein
VTTYSAAEKTFLLETARSVVTSEFLPGSTSPAGAIDDFPALRKKRGCFVTLHKRGALRGCIGTIEPIHPLIDCVKRNALNAAFHDPRFPSVKVEELPELNIEISVLTVPAPLVYRDPEDLKNKLVPGHHGVILSQGWHSATFLPQVWDQLPDKTAFLTHLCQKAGLAGKAWREKETLLQVYTVVHFSE